MRSIIPRTIPRFTTAVILSLLFSGCSGGQSGGSVARIEIRDGNAVCVFRESNGEYPVGKVDNGQVTLFATYGSVVVTMSDLEETVSRIDIGDGKKGDWRTEQRALANALFSQQLPGIWLVENASIDGKVESVRDEDPNYLVIRADKTYRIVKKGKKREGTWTLDSKGGFVMNATAGESRTAEMKRQPGDKLELTVDDDGRVVMLRYARTGLTVEPKAVDE